jgi:hypothetical protein
MAYFSNGTEGMDYQARYCERCVHDINQDCPVWLAHLMHNSAGCNDNEHILHLLIPRSKDRLTNEQCRMFHKRKDA